MTGEEKVKAMTEKNIDATGVIMLSDEFNGLHLTKRTSPPLLISQAELVLKINKLDEYIDRLTTIRKGLVELLDKKD